MLRFSSALTSILMKPMQLWGVYHLNPSCKRNQTPRIVCDSEAFAEKARERFPSCVIAPYDPQKGDNNRGTVPEMLE